MTDIADLTDFAPWDPTSNGWKVVGCNITRDQYIDKEGKLKRVLQLNGGRMTFKFQGRLIQQPDKYVPAGQDREEIMQNPKARFSCFVSLEYWTDAKKYEHDASKTAAAHAVARHMNDQIAALHPELPSGQLKLPFSMNSESVSISMKKSDSMRCMKIVGYRTVWDKETNKALYERAVVDPFEFADLDKNDCCTWAAETSSQSTNAVTDDKTGEVSMSTQYAPYCSCSIRERRKPVQAVTTAGSRELEDASAAAEAEVGEGTISTFVALDDDGNIVGETNAAASSSASTEPPAAQEVATLSASVPATAPAMTFDPTVLDEEPDDGGSKPTVAAAAPTAKRPRAADTENAGKDADEETAPRPARRRRAVA